VARGTGLLLTVDCGITCADEVAVAKRKGMEVIVTDHHEPSERLPECAILHPRLGGYPFGELCATAVAYKLSAALLGAERADRDLDLVALATVADLVPLRGENRALVRAGLALARRSPRVGLRALCAAAGVGPERLDEGDLAFRLGPRVNAAGRLYRADAGVELMLTEDVDQAMAIAAELDRAGRPSARCWARPSGRGPSCRRSWPRRRGWCWPERGGIPAWSGSWPRASRSATTHRCA
jgi:single-stranded-DNA-specific exonuclease